ncbi:MAG: glycosyltransferase family 2 protein [Pyrinomonadaceae bacterium]
MIKGLVSIIIPTFNRATCVLHAIESAQAQNYPAKEIIVVDDGSCDDTAQRVSGVEGIEYLYQPNQGHGAARNRGLRAAQGEYIASLDSDDLWDEDFLSTSIGCIEARNLDFVFINWTKVMHGSELQSSEWLRGRKWKRYSAQRHGDWFFLNPEDVRKLFLERNPAPSSSLVIRRSSIFSGWGEQMRIANDWYLVLDTVLHRDCFAAFTLVPRWKKGVDGTNIYDGKPFHEIGEQLHLHEYPKFRQDFHSLLTHRERLTLLGRELTYRLRVRLHLSTRSELAKKLRIPHLIDRVVNLQRTVR